MLNQPSLGLLELHAARQEKNTLALKLQPASTLGSIAIHIFSYWQIGYDCMSFALEIIFVLHNIGLKLSGKTLL